jgi:hypothetical protein
MNLVFVHGWSVTNTDTYGSLHKALCAAASPFNLEITIQHIYLGKYLSFDDEVSLDDIARAFNKALRELPGNSKKFVHFLPSPILPAAPWSGIGKSCFMVPGTLLLRLSGIWLCWRRQIMVQRWRPWGKNVLVA